MNEMPRLGQNAQLAPMNNFFGDDFLTLVYCSNEEHLTLLSSTDLPRIRAMLILVSDPASLKHERAAAAVDIGRFVRRKEKPPPKTRGSYKRQSGRSVFWFRLARELGSVVGANELANTLLTRGNLSVAFNAFKDVLPRIVSDKDDEGLDQAEVSISGDVVLAWRDGGSAAYRRLQRKFEGWTQEEFQCAMVCIVCYLSFSRSLTAAETHVEQRQFDLSWINPVWKALIEIAPNHLNFPYSDVGPEEIRQRLVEQRLVILHSLRDTPSGNNPVQTGVRRSDFAVSHGVMPLGENRCDDVELASPRRVAVLKGEIPPTAERLEREQLKQYARLADGVSLVNLPSLDALEAREAKLISEFPWAPKAITTVMSDLIARRRAGSLTLGIGTFLLVGEPGSGKTRFAQRLSGRLGTPSLVCNLAGMSDSKTFKGCSRGWGNARPSRMVEFIQQTRVANPFFILDEIDKLGSDRGNGDPRAALLDLLEPTNAGRYMDVFLMAECDLSYCAYIATANSLLPIPAPLMSRMQPVFFPRPGPEHTDVLIEGVLADFEASWGLPVGALSLSDSDLHALRGLSPREMRAAIPKMLGRGSSRDQYRRH
ncbi:AAA family ATPase [Achromobacter aloeverae]